MPGNKSFMDEFYNETMSEMAGNFFSRRRELESRLEGFGRLASEVRSCGLKALRRWKTFGMLLLGDAGMLEFLRQARVEADLVPPLAAASGEPWRFKPLFALTAHGRYRKSVRYAYQAMRQATQDYIEGAYGTDPKNPKKRIILPNYAGLKTLAETINKEVDAVNTAQCPSTVLAYAKSMDPSAAEKEAVTGGLTGENICKIDEDMAFKRVDFQGLGLPDLPPLPVLEDVENLLDEASGKAWSVSPDKARQALAAVSGS